MVALVLGTTMNQPVAVPVTAGAEGAKLQDGFGSMERPPGASPVHSVSDEVSARTLDDAGRDGQAGREGVAVVEQVAVLQQVVGAGIDRFALLELLERCAAPHPGGDVAGGGPVQQHQ